MSTAPSSTAVIAYADGACKGNPGPGGWGVLLQHPDGTQVELWGGEADTTNNRMELTAAIRALASLPADSRVEVWTDSSYVQKGITEWISGWKKRQWRKADGKAVQNADLWQALDQQSQRHQVSWHWVRGHNGHPGNEAADQLANRGVTDPQGPQALANPAPQPPQAALSAGAEGILSPSPPTAALEPPMTASLTPSEPSDETPVARVTASSPATTVSAESMTPRYCPLPNPHSGHRQLIFDTETTGLEVHNGDRIIEIGLIEVIDRRPTGQQAHIYLNPQRPVGDSYAIHGLSDEFLADQPLFAVVAEQLSAFMAGAELVAHNASFDVRFLDAELQRCGLPTLDQLGCQITDTLLMAKKRYPGQRTTLDGLAKRLEVRPRDRSFHGALLDAEILMDVYLAMTGGQVALNMQSDQEPGRQQGGPRRMQPRQLRVITASAAELQSHQQWLEKGDSAGFWQGLALASGQAPG